MTIMGMHCRADRAMAWVDSETFQNGCPAGFIEKLAVNHRARIIGIGAGRAMIAAAADDAALKAGSLDALIVDLPSVLRRAVVDVSTHSQSAPRCTYSLVGWSRRFGRLVCHRFDEPAYAAELVSTITLPHLDEVLAMGPEQPEDIIGVAQQQLAELRRRLPEATGGTLSIALMTRDQITVRKLDILTLNTPRPDGDVLRTMPGAPEPDAPTPNEGPQPPLGGRVDGMLPVRLP